MAKGKTSSIIALLSGPDRTGLVARTGSWIWERGSNILHASQHHDHEADVFFQRLEWTPTAGHNATEEADDFLRFARDELGMQAQVALSTDRPRIAVFVSKMAHCFHDIILRTQAGELRGEIGLHHQQPRGPERICGQVWDSLSPHTGHPRDQGTGGSRADEHPEGGRNPTGADGTVHANPHRVLFPFLRASGDQHPPLVSPGLCRGQALPPSLPARGSR